jgi:hypothetical protein
MSELRDELETLYLRRLMLRDAAIWRQRTIGDSARIEEPLEHELAIMVGNMKKVQHRLRRQQTP